MSSVHGETFLFTSESVNEGHPDKLADQVRPAPLQAFPREPAVATAACGGGTPIYIQVLGSAFLQDSLRRDDEHRCYGCDANGEAYGCGRGRLATFAQRVAVGG